MAKKDVQDPRRRSLFEEILHDISDLFRALKGGLRAPPAREHEVMAVEEELEALAQQDRPEPTAEAIRAPGPSPAPWPEPELISIPAGRFTMGSDKARDRQAFDNEFPQHQVYVGDFRIAKYPVTNAEYRRFVDATGHCEPRFWVADDERCKPFRGANHPIVQVTWADANAYCRWLSRMTGKSYRLPTEAEWEKAARGTDARIYPWGNTFDPGRCNSSESWINQGTEVWHTTPVDRYPSGASPYGVMDMTGNAWEWTASLYKPYPYDAEDGREDPAPEGSYVLRGGSWDYSRRHARVSSRCFDHPGIFNLCAGFRVVEAPVSSS